MDAVTAKETARLFGVALAELAEERDELQPITADLRWVREAMALPDLRAFLGNPLVPRRAKLDLVDQIFGGRANETLRLFFRVIVARRRERLMREIVAAALHECLIKQGYEIVFVTSAVKLAEDQETLIQEALAKAIGKPVHVEFRINPGLIGGIVVRRGDQLLDASVLGILSHIEELLAAGAPGGVGKYGNNGN